ncbi:MAG TPA: alpha/beta fold hydrolase [Bacteroidota bacterium]|nr:alpha/beta fold hydrolase [Bacteroidota bacterium]
MSITDALPRLSLRAMPEASRSNLANLLFLLLLFSVASALAQSPDGPWLGEIRVMGTELGIMVTFASKGDSVSATIDIPQQMALGLALKNVSWKPPKAHFELPAGPGLAVFDGKVAGDSVTGMFTQAGIIGTFRLEKGKTAGQAVKTPAPEPEPPPYGEENITYQSGGVTIAGTLTVPRGKGTHPAAVLITGSGAHNRDEELFNFRPFRVIADYLTRRGIAVLRCDDRGVGGSGGNKSACTSTDRALDVLAGVKFLEGRGDIDPRRIGLIGHSEGGIIAPVAAAESRDVAFIVLMAGPSITGARLIMYQIESQMRFDGAPDEEMRNELHRQERVFNCVRADTGWEGLSELLMQDAAERIAALPREQREGIADSAAFVKANGEARLAGVRTPWFRHFIDFDPAPALSAVRCPVLAVFGELDQQVPVALNVEPMEAALKRGSTKDWKIQVIPKANHLFIPAKTGAPAEYPSLEKTFAPGFLDLVGGWITKRVAVPGGARE